MHGSSRERQGADPLGRARPLVTIGAGGAPQVTCVWVAVDGDDLLTAHLNPQQRKLENVRRDPRVVVSFEGSRIRPPGCASTW